jgi:hypothetical protein
MKKLLLITFLLCAPFSVFAVTVANSASQAQAQALAGSQSGSGSSSGSNLNLYQTSNAPPVNLSNAVGMAYAPALTTTLTGTCMGSTSAGAGFAGGAFSIGSTWVDRGCTLRFNANSLVAIGDVAAARAVMCQDEDVRQAYALTGNFCPQDGVNMPKIRADSQRRQLELQAQFDKRYNVPTGYQTPQVERSQTIPGM